MSNGETSVNMRREQAPRRRVWNGIEVTRADPPDSILTPRIICRDHNPIWGSGRSSARLRENAAPRTLPNDTRL